MTESTTLPLPQPDTGLPVSGYSEVLQAGQAPLAVGGGREGAAPAGAVFAIGDAVAKVGGDYRFDGEVRGVITKLSGAVRYVVEDDRGVLHIYSDRQLARREEIIHKLDRLTIEHAILNIEERLSALESDSHPPVDFRPLLDRITVLETTQALALPLADRPERWR